MYLAAVLSLRQLREHLLGSDFWEKRQAVRSDVLGGAVILPQALAPEMDKATITAGSNTPRGHGSSGIDGMFKRRRSSGAAPAREPARPCIIDIGKGAECMHIHIHICLHPVTC